MAEDDGNGLSPSISAADLRSIVAVLDSASPRIERADPALAESIRGLSAETDKPNGPTDPNFANRVALSLHDAEALGGELPVPAELRARLATATEPDPAMAAGAAPRPEPFATGAGTAPTLTADELRGVVTALQAADVHLELVAPNLNRQIKRLASQLNNGVDPSEAMLSRNIAYTFLEAEKTLGATLVSANTRSALTHLAVTEPGLTNDRAQDLLVAALTISDGTLTRDIRRAAADIAVAPDQQGADILSRLEVLENRARTAPATIRDAGLNSRGAVEQPRVADQKPVNPESQTAAVAPDGHAARQASRPPPAAAPPQMVAATVPAGPLANLFAALGTMIRRPDDDRQAPWDGAPQSLSERLGRFETSMMRPRRQDEAIAAAAAAGRAALSALQEFSDGPGAAIMSRIQEAAKSAPGGMAEVLSEMRDGGRFADLRQQFNGALAAEKGLSASYDKAATALGNYGEQRAGVQTILPGRADATIQLGGFEKLDAEIGAAATNLPGRADGKSGLDELTEKARALVKAAMDAVQALVGRVAAPQASATAGPSATF